MNEQIELTAIDRYRGCLLGLACGDAVGTAVEFMPRGTFRPLVDMQGGGPFGLKPGEWTDDTSMALCLATSLVHKGGFDPVDQMNRYCNWRSVGYMSSNGECFDIGMTVAAALDRFICSGDPYAGSPDSRSAGNGALMRLAPIPMFYRNSVAKVLQFSGESTRTTHGAQEAIECSRLFGLLLRAALMGQPKSLVLASAATEAFGPRVSEIANERYRTKAESEIKGSGYCVESLEAAIWCFASTKSYSEAVLSAANLGDDADTTAAICGQLAGAFYGSSGIPNQWLDRLVMRGDISSLADELLRCSADIPAAP